ncbi:alpha/beta hydrolase [Solimonas marina]|uniref:Alpha/beta hydrolase n=1 Tax=Solimonas marina TaxID=2714601 RepID=A0A970B5R3_9GAMM|nr:alpha/beta hydrolase [Solimonas marina]NKF21860.1 alpha/beta hydrolase [Solimonas marina]
MSLQAAIVPYALRALKLALQPRVPVAVQRALSAAALCATPLPRGAAREWQNLGGVRCERLRRRDARPRRCILYLHGGGYVIGSPATHRTVTVRLALQTDADVIVPDYRLAPEHPYPAALDDALQVWRALRDGGRSADDIIVAGDSAGGGLALSLVLALRDRGEALPTAVATISPWVDLALTGDSVQARAARDPLITPACGTHWSALYRGAARADDPGCSPLYAGLAGLPPLLVHVGSEEVIYDDAQRLVAKARAAGVAVTLREYPGLWHDFHLQAGLLPEAGVAVAEIATFCRVSWNDEGARRSAA